ncbi:MAG TPA: DMT family transporter [Candidatus Eisenbacteria bacterium]|jgi:drug/metabolite transporter (DMT)-like permease
MRYSGELAALGTAACFGGASNLFAAAGRRMGSHVLNRLRIPTAWIFLSLALWTIHHAWWPVWATPTALVALAISGMVGFVFGDAWGFRAIVILGPGRASLLAATAPLFTTALAWPILHQRPGPLAFLGMLLTLGGVAVAITSRSRRQAARAKHAEGSERLGIVAGLLGALGQAGGMILSKIGLRTGLDPLSATVVRIAAATITVWALTVAQRQVRPTLGALADGRATAFMAAGAFMGPFLGVTLALTSLYYIEAGVSASITALSPLVAMLLAARFHGERLTWRAIAGAVVAIAGVVILFRR